MAGKVVLLGAGPGDPLLLTLKGREYISKADCIVYDRLANDELLAYAKADCKLIYVGKENHHHTMKQEDINELLGKIAMDLSLVVRLKGGDSYVFGRGGEEALFLSEKGIEVEVIPGISSVIAALEDAGIPITHRGLSKGFYVVTAHSSKDAPSDIDFRDMLKEDITYLFLMGLAHVGVIARGLMEAGRTKNTPIAVISNGTTPMQRKVIGTLENIEEKVMAAGLESPAIIVVGKVVTLSDQLNFFESKPLFGKKYLVPYIERFSFSYYEGRIAAKNLDHFESELEMELRDLGAYILPVKVGRIEPVKIEKEKLQVALKADYILFTSQNGVNAFLWNLREAGLDARSLGRAKIAAVGNKTAEALMMASLRADIIPGKQTAKDLNDAVLENIEKELKGKKVSISYFGADLSNQDSVSKLEEKADYSKFTVYKNTPVEYTNTCKDTDFGNYDGIFFTSGSTVKRMKKLTNGSFPDKIYSIGPACSKVIEAEIGKKYIQADISSYRGLIDLVK